jgi:4'-phosphopantetheinyl transferase
LVCVALFSCLENPRSQNPMIKTYYSYFKKPLPLGIFQNYLGLLPDSITSKILNLRNSRDRHGSLFGKLLLSRCLADFGLDSCLADLKYTRYNRPYLDLPVDFNISHSENLVVCIASTTCAVGIDIEKISPVNLLDFDSQWTETERAVIKKSKVPELAFYYFWTRKEAVVKADGKGLSIPLKSIDVSDDVVPLDGNIWFLSQAFLAPDYCCSIACNREITTKGITVCSVDFYSDENMKS